MKYPLVIKNNVEFRGMIKQKSCGISRDLGFLAVKISEGCNTGVSRLGLKLCFGWNWVFEPSEPSSKVKANPTKTWFCICFNEPS